MSESWVGVDFDGTLAKRVDNPQSENVTGMPIWPMVEMVRGMRAQGQKVKIFTARAWPPPGDPEKIEAVREWCIRYIGEALPVTCSKDPDCVAIYDDIAYGVVPDAGEVIGG